MRRLLLGTLAFALLAAPATPPDSDGAPEPRAAMQGVFAALERLLPDALAALRWADPERRDEIARGLDDVAASAGRLEEHARTRDEDFASLGSVLAEELRRSRDAFAGGDLEQSRYLLLVATRHCVECHSRLPAARDFPLAPRLTESVEVRALDPRARAHFYVATRSFDAALSTWEAWLADPSLPPSRIDTGGALFDYLTIALRVEHDAPRARHTLERLAARPDLPAPLRAAVLGWAKALGSLGDALTGPPSLPRARAIVDEATALATRPDGRERAVHDLVASSLLYRWLDEHRGSAGDASERAEAYYLLGVIEARSAEGYWVPRTGQHLERAIRLDPKGPHARSAWILLEETSAGAYGGVDGPHTPPEVRARLRELRALIDG